MTRTAGWCVAERAAARVLCLGNDLIADDAVGPEVACRLRARSLPAEVVESAETGFALLDHVAEVSLLVVVDAVVTGGAAPGTVHVLDEGEIAVTPGGSQHYVGLFEALDLVRHLGQDAPDRVVLVAVEAGDLVTVGGPMTPPVAGVVERVAEIVAGLVGDGT